MHMPVAGPEHTGVRCLLVISPVEKILIYEFWLVCGFLFISKEQFLCPCSVAGWLERPAEFSVFVLHNHLKFLLLLVSLQIPSQITPFLYDCYDQYIFPGNSRKRLRTPFVGLAHTALRWKLPLQNVFIASDIAENSYI